MNNFDRSKNSSSLKELYMINAQTYHALLNKLTTLERSEIDRLNTRRSEVEDENLSQPSNSVYMTATGTDENASTSVGQAANVLSTNPSVSQIHSMSQKNEHPFHNENEPDSSDIGDLEYDEDDEEESVLGEGKKIVQTDINLRKRKRKHEMPHLIKLSTGPGILRYKKKDIDYDQEEGTQKAQSVDQEKDPLAYFEPESSKTEDDLQKQSADKISKDKNQCPVCFKVYTNSFTKIRHLTSMHPTSEEAKQAWSMKKSKELKNRSKMRLKTKAINHLNDNIKIIAPSNSNKSINNRNLKRGRMVEDDSESDIDEYSKKEKNSKSTSNIEAINSDDEIIPEENIVKSRTTIAGVKRTKARDEDAIDNKMLRAAAPKRKAKVDAIHKLKGKKARRSNRNYSKKPKLSKGSDNFEDTDDDEYPEW